MKKTHTLKLSLIVAAVCLYGFASFADTSKTPKEKTGSKKTDSKKETAKVAPAKEAPAQEAKLWGMSAEEAQRRSVGCNDCHNGVEDMHGGVVNLGCIDCHGGDANVRAQGLEKGSSGYEEAKKKSHVQPKFPESWKTSANPERSYDLVLQESAEFIRFVNPGDLRVAQLSCGTSGCHTGEVHDVNSSMMTTGAMLWGAALYNNGSTVFKNYRFGESYGPDGSPRRLQSFPQPTPEETQKKGWLPYMEPLQRWEISQMGNILRTFERGGRKAAEIGNPITEDVPGKPTQNLLSFRGLGTLLTTDPVFLGLQKTRLFDPSLSFMGTNDVPGDYRSSGCTACHVVYANDRDMFHSGPYAKFGHTGLSKTADPTIPKDEPGHPIKHQFTRSIPSSQCVTCHMHPGTLVLMTYYGTMWWDLETDGEHMYPKESRKLSPEQQREVLLRNPEESALRGNWGDPDFLRKLRDEVNPKLKHNQFADFTGHGWVFKNVFKRDRKGNLLDAEGNRVENASNEKLRKAVEELPPEDAKGLPVHLKDIHIEKGMHCVDCHFKQDNHGNSKLYGEVRNAIEIDCADCHGTITKRADPTSRDATTSAAAGGNRMLEYRYVTPEGTDRARKKDRFFKDSQGRLFQRSAVEANKVWEVKQVADTVNPSSPVYNEKAALAKTVMKDGKSWGDPQSGEENLAHANSRMTCYSCHLSWTPSCFGCHLKMKANEQKPMLHNEGEKNLRNWTSYNFQTLRDDVFMLGKDGSVTGRRVAPVRSACAVLVSSQNALREWIYSQQQTVSAEGYSGQAFSSHFPHTVRTRETKSCDDCHLSEKNDNNAYMAMALMQGTNFYNWIGRFVYVALGHEGFAAVVATERDEPQAVIGSYLHKLAFPEEYKKHKEHHEELHEYYEHPGNDIKTALTPFINRGTEVLNLQLRGEYLYAACGKGGFNIYDVANIDHKGFSERITTAPFSPLGQRFYVKSKHATAIASPSTLAVDPTATVAEVLNKKGSKGLRRQYIPENEEGVYRDDKQMIPAVYGFLYGTDSEEGLIVIGNELDEDDNGPGVATLLDGDPTNNFIKRALAFNPDGKLKGANNIIVAGTRAYITCDRGLVVVDLTDPLKPKITAEIGEPFIKKPKAVQLQFRYAFVCDSEGVKVLDATDPDHPRPVEGAVVHIEDAHNIYPVRTYAYVAAGKKGLVILDIENPEKPRIDQTYDAEGKINDAHDVKVGMTNFSLFAYIADGHNGLRVVQLTSPEEGGGGYGFSPRPTPHLIATFHSHAPALAVSEGIDRDRAADESGNQLAVFGRRGARPLNLAEMQRMYMKDGKLWRVPQIRDSNTKENQDIRRFYGPPKGLRASEKTKSQPVREEKKSDEEPMKSPPSPIGLLPLSLPLALALFRLRRR